MTTAALTPARRDDTPPRPRLSFANVVSSEWTKLVTLRSTFVIAAIMVVVSVGFSFLIASSMASVPELDLSADRAIATSVAGSVSFAQLVVGILAVLMVSNEYGTNMIQSTTTAVPRRLPTLAAKALLAVVVTVALSVVSSVAAYAVSSAALDGEGLVAPVNSPRILGAIAYSALYLALVAVFAVAVATIVRTTAGAIAIVVGMFFVLPIAASAITFGDVTPAHYLLSYSGDGLMRTLYDPSWRPEALQNALLTAAWIAVPAVTAVTALTRRDA